MLGYGGSLLGAIFANPFTNVLPTFSKAPNQYNWQQTGDSPIGRRNAVGFVLSHEQFPGPDLIEFGAAADNAGFDTIWASDHFHPWQDNEGHSGLAWVTLAAVGQRAAKVGFGTGVTCPTYRYRPTIVAEAFASLGLLYPGRIFLGVGTGEALNEQPSGGGWGKYTERAERLIEAVQIIKRLWAGETVNFDGKYYKVEKAKLYDLPQAPIPIYIAAWGMKSMALSGEYGDGLISDSKTVLDPEKRAAWAAGAKKVGKDSTQMPILAEHFVHVGTEKDPELQRAAELWRFTPKAWTNFVNNPDSEAIRKQADMVVPLEEVYNNWTISEDPQDHAKAIKALFDGGVTQVYIHSGQTDQKKVIDFYSKQVLPLVRAQTQTAEVIR